MFISGKTAEELLYITKSVRKCNKYIKNDLWFSHGAIHWHMTRLYSQYTISPELIQQSSYVLKLLIPWFSDVLSIIRGLIHITVEKRNVESKLSLLVGYNVLRMYISLVEIRLVNYIKRARKSNCKASKIQLLFSSSLLKKIKYNYNPIFPIRRGRENSVSPQYCKY